MDKTRAMDNGTAAGATPVTLAEHVVARRSRGGALAALTALAGFGAIFAIVRARRSDAVDLALTLRWQAVRRPELARVMTAVSWPGFAPQSRLIPPLLVGFLVLMRLPLEAALQLAAWGTSGLSEGFKHLMQRPRPVAGKDLRVVAASLGGSSFPSGHVITYVSTYGWLGYVAHATIRPPWLRRVVVASLLGLIGTVGPSRIYQGHHWPTDVAASYLMGTSYLLGLISVHRTLIRRRGRRRRPAATPPPRHRTGSMTVQ
jgi:membrane-associated phospholipid phosphatase